MINFSNPNSTLLEAFVEDWPEPVEDTEEEIVDARGPLPKIKQVPGVTTEESINTSKKAPSDFSSKNNSKEAKSLQEDAQNKIYLDKDSDICYEIDSSIWFKLPYSNDQGENLQIAFNYPEDEMYFDKPQVLNPTVTFNEWYADNVSKEDILSQYNLTEEELDNIIETLKEEANSEIEEYLYEYHCDNPKPYEPDEDYGSRRSGDYPDRYDESLNEAKEDTEDSEDFEADDDVEVEADEEDTEDAEEVEAESGEEVSEEGDEEVSEEDNQEVELELSELITKLDAIKIKLAADSQESLSAEDVAFNGGVDAAIAVIRGLIFTPENVDEENPTIEIANDEPVVDEEPIVDEEPAADVEVAVAEEPTLVVA